MRCGFQMLRDIDFNNNFQNYIYSFFKIDDI